MELYFALCFDMYVLVAEYDAKRQNNLKLCLIFRIPIRYGLKDTLLLPNLCDI